MNIKPHDWTSLNYTQKSTYMNVCFPDLSDFAIWATIPITIMASTIKIIPGIFQHVVI